MKLIVKKELSNVVNNLPTGQRWQNVIIKGDNVDSLQLLKKEQTVCGSVTCVFIDPPYNTNRNFEHYNDSVESAAWLKSLEVRLLLLRDMLADTGSIWITIDDKESHYLKVLCDGIFNRKNFVSNVVWQRTYSVANNKKLLSSNHDHILVYAKDITKLRFNGLPRSNQTLAGYSNKDNDPRGSWKSENLLGQEFNPKNVYGIKSPLGAVTFPKLGSSWRLSEERLLALQADNRIVFGVKGNVRPRRKLFLNEVNACVPCTTIWKQEDVSHTAEAKKHAQKLVPNNVFATPKPEKLLYRILTLATNEGDIVLDAFAGSGTTGAVAHKLGRKWIMLELGNHAETHIVTRLNKVIAGEDPDGVTDVTNWRGGGSFIFCEVKPETQE